MRDRGFRRLMQFNIKRRVYEHILTASSVCIDTTKQLWYFTSDNINLIAITLSKILKEKKEKSKIGLE